ncbi:MAG: sigma-70 family RNA polymerase sigma factor [Clostridia bacterium]|nr:sigma-70 family RNA polymerase sigma factor [Clostridia bacterium]
MSVDARNTADEQIRRLMESYGTAMLRMCYLSLHDAMLAEDAVQDSFLKAYQKWHTFRGECSEKTWLMRIAINTCRDYQRRAWFRWQSRSVNVDQLVIPGGTPVDTYDDTVLKAVMALPPREREVVLLRYYQEMRLQEISQTLGIPEGTVTSRLNRARSKLRRQLEGWYFDEEL